ncbi:MULTISPECIES: replication initiation protein RepM [Acinetobacter]|uniref:replication initiation protein RepM n=1 Tax=Acinetobacter TaxID=469 RepID=UPI00056FDE9F|nr:MULTISPECIES: replication initiation protein RepM [Acinetobacter]MCZ3066939.1 replication initiation protein RepM [Acinetobacter baumannii]MDI9742140.1 replication initiation protein RepM [Acinetobacter baumannii]RSB50226.1 RepB family plasmid replication initiator protein [Acinetobacter soli]TPU88329.1 replication initiation protein [Acinetobacter baumannii]SSQ69907.1 DNA replication protein [Acinetobacter baumannii]
MKNGLVVKDNALINASYNLELTEQRLVMLAIINARELGQGITADSKLEIHASDYAKLFNVSPDASYKALKEAVNNLFNRQFSYTAEYKKTGKVGIVRSRWVSRIFYVDDLALLEITFAPDVVPLITRLEEHFTKYEAKQVAHLTSKYATRLYELLIAWREVGKTPFFELQQLRKNLGVEDDEYQRMHHFKSRVLETAITQINEHTDIKATYEQHKQGRTITGFSFKFKQKKQPQIETKRDPNTPDFFIKMTDAQRHLFANKMSEMPEMSKYSQGTETYQQFAIRIADMLLQPEKFRELYPLLKKLGYSYS